MPDIDWGYGFPIGGVAATDDHGGVVSPGILPYLSGVTAARNTIDIVRAARQIPAVHGAPTELQESDNSAG